MKKKISQNLTVIIFGSQKLCSVPDILLVEILFISPMLPWHAASSRRK